MLLFKNIKNYINQVPVDTRDEDFGFAIGLLMIRDTVEAILRDNKGVSEEAIREASNVAETVWQLRRDGIALPDIREHFTSVGAIKVYGRIITTANLSYLKLMIDSLQDDLRENRTSSQRTRSKSIKKAGDCLEKLFDPSMELLGETKSSKIVLPD